MPPTIDIEALLEAAISRHEARDLDGAEQLYRQILDADPDNAEALNLVGVILQDRGRAAESIPPITRATEIDPAYPDAFANLARGLRLLGEQERAVAAARRAVDLDPELGEAWLQLGLALVTLQRHQEALDALRKAAGHSPHSAEVHTAIGVCAQVLRDCDTAIDAWRVVLETQPDRLDALNNLGGALSEMKRYDEALTVHRRALDLAPRDPLVLGAYAHTLYRRMDADELISVCRACLELAPDNVDVMTMLVGGLTWRGKFDEAREVCRTGLELRPDNLWLKHQLNDLDPDSADRDAIAQFRTDLDNTALPMDQRLVAAYSLGKALERQSDYDGAFSAFAAANGLEQSAGDEAGKAFDVALFEAAIDEICSFYTAPLFQRARSWGNESELPVFIVGLPRSGTTLVEQIAASHPRVCGLGERKDIWELLGLTGAAAATRSLGAWDAERFRRVTGQHIAHLRTLAGDADRAIDKLPDNIQLLGQIRVLFPNARIIMCRRDLRDVCLSCFTTHFKEDIKWTHDLRISARRAVEIDQLADHWRAVLPGPVLEVTYETLVGNLESEARRLIAFLGLEWDPACLEFHKTERSVTTASLFQVRRPIYTDSIGRWRRYEAHLGPMLKILAGRVPEEPGVPRDALLERAKTAGEEGRWDDAIEAGRHVLAIDPAELDMINLLGVAYGEKGDLPQALRHFDKSVEIDPDQPAMWRNRGLALLRLGRPQDAILCFDRLIALLPQEDMGHALRAETLLCLGHFSEALSLLDRLVQSQPADSNTAVSRGLALQWCGRLDEAGAEFDRAIALQPDSEVGWLNKAQLSLSRGDLPGGFRIYERRWHDGATVFDPMAVKPLWLGESDLAGKNLLLHAEQGFGDTIQFCRYATMAAQAGARVILAVPSALTALMETLNGVSRVMDETVPPPDHDLHCPLMSLPLAFGTNVETIPAAIPYLRADPDDAAAWRERLAPLRGRRVGLVWAGTARAGDASMAAADFRRSLPLAALAPLASVAGVTFLSLQLGPPAAEAARAPDGLSLVDHTYDLRTFADTAALVENLDLVISVDTAAAHLAGAMGKPVWLLNRFDTCWRWMLDRDDSPWYPTLRLFRQNRPGDWNSVIDAVVAALHEFAEP